jgi:hypothetical protein
VDKAVCGARPLTTKADDNGAAVKRTSRKVKELFIMINPAIELQQFKWQEDVQYPDENEWMHTRTKIDESETVGTMGMMLQHSTDAQFGKQTATVLRIYYS